MNHRIFIALLALLAWCPTVRAEEKISDAAPLVKSTAAPTPVPSAAPPVGEDEEPAPPAKPTRVGPPPKKETPAEEDPIIPTTSVEDLKDPEPPRPVEELKDAPPLIPKDGTSWLRPHQPLFGSASPLLQLSARMDVSFLAGGSVSQGFSLPSVRVTAAGSAGEIVHYRLSLGQTREFSAVQLPQITPVEGYVEFQRHNGDTQELVWRVGMFTPAWSPWWSPDLSEVSLPDYHEIDRTLLLARDLGMQLTYRPFHNQLKITAGIFNGNGIISLNTNSSRAYVGNLEWTLGHRKSGGMLGGSIFRMQQAGPGSVNYRSDTVGSLYASAFFYYGRLKFTGELLGGQLVDSTRTANPFGMAGTVDVGMWRWGRLFTRGETVQGSGVGTGIRRRFQIGPVLELAPNTEAWLLYDYDDSGTNGGLPQQQAYVRLRLSV